MLNDFSQTKLSQKKMYWDQIPIWLTKLIVNLQTRNIFKRFTKICIHMHLVGTYIGNILQKSCQVYIHKCYPSNGIGQDERC